MQRIYKPCNPKSEIVMDNVYQLQRAKITKIVVENVNTKSLFLQLDQQKSFQFLAGQFMMIGLPGFGECPISISSNPKDARKHLTLTIRAVGELTTKLIGLKKGDYVYVRGPFGNGFPEVTKNLILIGGGCGFIPLRSVFEENRNRKDIKIQLFIGCKNENSLVFRREFKRIMSRHDLQLILEEKILPGISHQKGLITDLIKKQALLPSALIFICGPEIMYKFAVKELLAKGVSPTDIFLSLEKRMHCGVGICQHCALGSKYVCKDGPVFSYEFLKDFPQYKF